MLRRIRPSFLARPGHSERTAEGQQSSREGSTNRPRRALLTGAAAALGAVTAEVLTDATPAQATQGSAVIEGADNTGATRRTSVFTTGNVEWASLADPNTSGKGSVGAYLHGQDYGVYAEGANSTSVGVYATGQSTGVAATGAYGVQGIGTEVGVYAVGPDGVLASGNDPTQGIGVHATGNGTGAGVIGYGGSGDAPGVAGTGGGSGPGVSGTGGVSGGYGVIGYGTGTGDGVIGSGGSSGGDGVYAVAGAANAVGLRATNSFAGGTAVQGAATSGDGAVGIATSGRGLYGVASAAAGVGVAADNTADGTALSVTGKAVFSRSGILTVPPTKSSVTKTGVPLTATSLVLATLQQNAAGVWVQCVVKSTSADSFTVHLNKAVTVGTQVAWFVVN